MTREARAIAVVKISGDRMIGTVKSPRGPQVRSAYAQVAVITSTPITRAMKRRLFVSPIVNQPRIALGSDLAASKNARASTTSDVLGYRVNTRSACFSFVSAGDSYGLMLVMDARMHLSGNAPDQRGPGVDHPFVKTDHRSSVAVRPTMGVILWGASPLYLVPVSFTTRQYTKCNSHERQYEAKATAGR